MLDPYKRIWLVRVGAPFHAIMISIEEFEFFLEAVEEEARWNCGPVLHLDTTSSLVRPYTIPNGGSLK